ncbi:MAG: SRPBCC family protein [Planctomycetota bacterium]
MRQQQIENEIHIAREPAAVFAYVTVPSRWHEWHPASERASEQDRPLIQGDTFTESASLRPLYPLPIVLRCQLKYKVTACSPPYLWEVLGESDAIEVRIRYELAEGRETHFRRRLTYRVKGWLRILEPILVRPKMRRQSAQALQNLKHQLEG